MVDIGLGDIGVEILAFDESQEKFVHDLDVRPRDLQNRLVLLGIESFPLWVHRGWDGPEQILGKHLDDTRIHGLSDDLAIVRHVVQQLVQRQTLDLLRFHVATSIVEVEDDVALVDLLHEELLATVGWHFVEAGELLQFAMG